MTPATVIGFGLPRLKKSALAVIVALAFLVVIPEGDLRFVRTAASADLLSR